MVVMQVYVDLIVWCGLVELGKWVDYILDLVEVGKIDVVCVLFFFRDFMVLLFDIMILGMVLLFWMLGMYFDQWQMVVEDFLLLWGVINESLWFEVLICGFICVVICDVVIGEVIIFVQVWVLMLFVLVNCDEWKWDDFECFDIKWCNFDYFGFGFGVYSCVGMYFVCLEMECLMMVFLVCVREFMVFELCWMLNNILCGFESL